MKLWAIITLLSLCTETILHVLGMTWVNELIPCALPWWYGCLLHVHFHCIKARKQVLLTPRPSGRKWIFSFASCVCLCVCVPVLKPFFYGFTPASTCYLCDVCWAIHVSRLISISTGALPFFLQSYSPSAHAATWRAAPVSASGVWLVTIRVMENSSCDVCVCEWVCTFQISRLPVMHIRTILGVCVCACDTFAAALWMKCWVVKTAKVCAKTLD